MVHIVKHTTITLFALVFLFLPVKSTAQLTPEQATAIDSMVAGDFGLYPNVDFDETHIFFTPAGNRYDITLALATATDTIPGSGMSGYAWKQNLTPVLEAVLLDSLPNTCFAVVDIDTVEPASYRAFATNHLLECGYIITSTGDKGKNKKFTIIAYPNPFTGQLKIKTTGNSKSILIEVFTPAGKKIMETNPKSAEPAEIDLTGLPGGLYLFTVVLDDGTRVNGKVVKK